MFKPKNKIRTNSGFTLIELITSLAIFSVLIAILSALFISSLTMQRRAFNIQQLVENSNFILDAMTKEVRTARVRTSASPSDILDFANTSSESVQYSLAGGSVHRTVNGTDTVMNSNAVEFTRLQFYISGVATGDKRQPRITIVASLRSREVNQRQSMDIQTTLSQRYLSN